MSEKGENRWKNIKLGEVADIKSAINFVKKD